MLYNIKLCLESSELKIMQKEAAVASFEVLLQNFSRGSKEYHKNSYQDSLFSGRDLN